MSINDLDKLNRQKMAILSVCSPADKVLLEEYVPSKYEVKFQGGAYFTQERVCEYNDYDDANDQISELNHRLSELTVWYYAWKHIACDYIGICHYRRKFDISDDEIDMLMAQDYDAIVGELCYCEKSIKDDYLDYHYAYDWTVMMDIIKEQQPEYYDAIDEYFEGHLFYTACMYIYKREIFYEASEFVFPILLEFCKRRPEKKDIYWRRDAGFLGERLFSFYFYYHRNKMKYREVNRKLLETKQVVISEELKTEQQILYQVQELFRKHNLYAISELIQKAENQQSEVIAATKILVAICIGEMREGKDTLLDYISYSDDFLKLYQLLVESVDTISDFLQNQNVVTAQKMSRLIKQGLSVIAVYRIMLFNQMLSEDSAVLMITYFISNNMKDYALYFCDKAKEKYPNNLKITYLEQMISE